MKHIGYALGLTCMLATAQAAEQKQSYDSDLFRKDKKVIFTNVEFLYWTVDEGALDYALKMDHPAWGNPSEGVGHLKTASFGWHPGVRVNIGYFNAPHYWDGFVQYTHFKGTHHQHTGAPDPTSNKFLNGTWPEPALGSNEQVPLTGSKSSISLRLDILETLFSRRYHPNPHLRSRLFGGPTVAWLAQDWDIHYHDAAKNHSHAHNRWNFTGAGIRAGFMVDWFLGKGGFYFTGLTSAAVYAGSYHNTSKQFSSDSNHGQFTTSLPLRNVKYEHTRLVPHIQILGGPSWQQAFSKVRTEIFIGYELNFWANLHEVYRTSMSAPTQAKQIYLNTGIVGIQGLTVRWNLDW